MALFDTTFAPYHPFGSRLLNTGATGTDVAVVQAVYDLMLSTMNPASGPIGSPITIDGKYGAATKAAVRGIQSYFGISADGVVGDNTYWLYGQGVGSHTTYGGPVYGSRQLDAGNSGGDVTILQNRLNLFRYASLIGHPATTTFDSATAAAVLAFKSDAESNGDTGFPPNAIAGFGFYDATWIYTFAGGRAVETGRNGFDVAFLQVLLKELGYYAGRVTGYYDDGTRDAVRSFQRAAGITADGVVGPATFYQLGTRNPHAAPNPLGIAWPPAVTPEVSVCSAPLAAALPSNLHPFGSASLTINESEGFEALNVIGNTMPEPASFGTRYGTYAFTLTNPSTGAVVANQLLTRLPGGDDWGGSLNVGVATIPKGEVAVYPTPPGSSMGPYGPRVLVGTLAGCH